MKVQQGRWSSNDGWKDFTGVNLNGVADLVLAFGDRKVIENTEHFDKVKDFFPSAEIIMNSTAGEILGSRVFDGTIVLTAIKFEKTKIKTFEVDIADHDNSLGAGVKLAKELSLDKLKHVMVFSDGSSVNGSDLATGFNSTLPKGITATGGLAGDAARFEKTLCGLNKAPSSGKIAAVGFYGEELKVGFSSVGGWDSFGPERLVTKSKGNVLYELDGKSALELYKTYLGDKASGLPGTALLFPLSMKTDSGKSLVRTILSVSEEEQSMTFAGDIYEGSTVRLMRANFDKLIDGAYEAAENSADLLKENTELAILVSCVGRKLVLDQRIEEEVESVVEIVGENCSVTGFYSYGELAPFFNSVKCDLHNQTMTVTLFSEK